jgi:hypothetical protein
MTPIPFDNSYARLPDRFFSRLPPTPVAQPAAIKVNHALAGLLGIEPLWLESAVYRFNPDLTEDERRVIHASILKDAMSTLDFLNCGDLLTTKPKP